MAICEHIWGSTGKQGVHVEFPTETSGKKQLYAFYVRCIKCGQLGFRRHPHDPLIFTWVD